jgi:hypothetical protein
VSRKNDDGTATEESTTVHAGYTVSDLEAITCVTPGPPSSTLSFGSAEKPLFALRDWRLDSTLMEVLTAIGYVRVRH